MKVGSWHFSNCITILSHIKYETVTGFIFCLPALYELYMSIYWTVKLQNSSYIYNFKIFKF